MDFTIYGQDGRFLGTHTSTNGEIDPIMIPDGGSIVDGHHDIATMLVDGQVVALSGAILEQYNAELLQMLRLDRNKLLADSDWTQANDSPLSASKRTEWATYRQALRDLPSNTIDPSQPVWPTPPQ